MNKIWKKPKLEQKYLNNIIIKASKDLLTLLSNKKTIYGHEVWEILNNYKNKVEKIYD